MKQLKKNTIIILTSVLLSYLLNSYWYNTFDSSKFPLEAKILTSAMLFIMILIYFAVVYLHEGELIKDKKKLQDELKFQKEGCNHDWQPAESLPEWYDTCIKCKCKRGKKH